MSNSSSISGRWILRKAFTYLAFFGLLFWLGFPVYYMLITSFMDPPELGCQAATLDTA